MLSKYHRFYLYYKLSYYFLKWKVYSQCLTYLYIDFVCVYTLCDIEV